MKLALVEGDAVVLGKLRVSNWSGTQHYRKRNPPWVKLSRELLNDLRYMTLSDQAGAMYPKLCLLASETKSSEGLIPNLANLEFRLRLDQATIRKVLDELVAAGLLEPV